MSKSALNAIFVALVAALSVPAYAQGDQDKQDKVVATLRVDKGVIMSSTGGEFITANTGEQLIKDERLMVSKDSSATVVYNDHCQHTYDDPGVYKIDAECKAAIWWFDHAGVTAAIIAGAIVVGVIVDNGDNNHPISR